MQVLRRWRRFCAGIASNNTKGTKEEGIYDEEYKAQVEDRLRRLRKVHTFQAGLDDEITDAEVFAALRKAKPGTSPDEYGTSIDVLRTAADAVNNNKLRGDNAVVNALTLLFNFVLDREVWPQRWSTGVIFPLYKQDSRLDPGNYRPITILSVVGKLFGTIINKRLSAWAEKTGMLVDEQGGFRQSRGTPDQLFILREILNSRKERNLPTFVTYIDARKAYDTVWREAMYVMMYDKGVKGRLWRQLQRMHSSLSRKVKLPGGTTEPFEVERGVAQGAVESPLLYATFIDGLALALKRAGYGVWIAGQQVPLLLYADDVVLISGSVKQLHAMNAVASEYARKHRFQFNGAKSGVMAFNVTNVARTALRLENWELFGEKVEVKHKYKYLGVETYNAQGNWSHHVKKAIGKARRVQADLIWLFRQDTGLRPRTAMSMWNALVRPIVEYAAELWAGAIPASVAKDAEKLQMEFARSVLGLPYKGGGIADEFVRAELGIEPIECRFMKLRLGYWRRIWVANPSRLLFIIAAFRRRETIMDGKVLGSRGWMVKSREILERYGLRSHWDSPDDSKNEHEFSWKNIIYESVERHADEEREARMNMMNSMSVYNSTKSWEPSPAAYSVSSKDCMRRGMYVCERYLDRRQDLQGTKIKLLCRSEYLPLLSRVGRETNPPLPKCMRVCIACQNSEIESVSHFVLKCPKYAEDRANMLSATSLILNGSDVNFLSLSSYEKLCVLLGKRSGDPDKDERVDIVVTRFLRKAWKKRSIITGVVNTVLDRNDNVRY